PAVPRHGGVAGRELAECPDEVAERAARPEPEQREQRGKRAAEGDHAGEGERAARAPAAGARALREIGSAYDRAAAERRFEQRRAAEQKTRAERGEPAPPRLAHREHEPEQREQAAERFGLPRVPEVELKVDEGGDGAADEADRAILEEHPAEPPQGGHDAEQDEHFDEAHGGHAFAEERLRERVREEDAGRIEIPELAVQHMAGEHAVANHRVDALIAPEWEGRDLNGRETDDRPTR